MRNAFRFLAPSLLAAVLMTGCGSATPTSLATASSASAPVEALGIPPQSAFVTIQVKVIQILPEDTTGLPHQNFIVTETAPDAGVKLAVNNDTKYGSKVANLVVGQALSIRGVVYHDKLQDGIHWTHHANKTGDAGWIKDAAGHVFE